MTLPSHRHGVEISAVTGASCLLLTYTTQYGRLNEHESRRDAGLAHDVIKNFDRARSIGVRITVTRIADQLVDNYERQRGNSEPQAAPTMNWIRLLQA